MAMAPHLSAAELDLMRQLLARHKSTADIRSRINGGRLRAGIAPVGIDACRRAAKGSTHLLGRAETRGRKKVLGKRAIRAMNKTRKELIKKAKGQYEVHWKDVIKAARVQKVHRTTAKRSFLREGLPVEWRRAREKPMRSADIEKERHLITGRWRFLPLNYFTEKVDLIIDNKKFDVPVTDRARAYVRQLRVRGHLRTPSEGLQPNFTKVNARKNRINTGGVVNVCAGISNGKVVLWHYLQKRWSGEAAAALYRGPLLNALRRARGEKAKYLIVEDNDRTGYKSKKAMEAKHDKGIDTVEWPRYSPDLNPLDFFLWSEVERRMNNHKVKGRETIAAYKARLRRTAMNIPRAMILKAVASMKDRARAVFSADGGNIAQD